MTTVLLIRDEEHTGKVLNEISLEISVEKISVRELIRSRVYQEVKDFNSRQYVSKYNGLVQPTEKEQELNDTTFEKAREIDWQKQFKRVIEAFEKNQIMVLVNARQVESLDTEIEINKETNISFLRLMLLAGG